MDAETLARLDRQFAQAGMLTAQGKLADADAVYDILRQALPGNYNVISNLGILRANRGMLADAVVLLQQAAQIQPGSAAAHFNLAITLQSLNNPDAIVEAAASFERSLALDPNQPQALLGLGNCHAGAQRIDDAIACFERALRIDPDFAPALVNLGRWLSEQGALDRALAACEKVVALRPGNADAHFNLGVALKLMGRFAEAEAQLRQAVTLKPDFAAAWLNLGNAIKVQNRFADAAAAMAQAIALKPDYVIALNNLGHVRYEQGFQQDAIALHTHALALEPGDAHAQFALCVAQLPILYRDEADITSSRAAYTRHLQALHDRVMAAPDPSLLQTGVGASQPFYLPYQNEDDRALQSLYGAAVCKIMAHAQPPIRQPAWDGRIRVGIVSSFFRDHSNWKIPVSGWMTQLDRDRFALLAYHTGNLQDSYTDRARSLCERFVQGPFPLDRWRQEILADQPHVLIYPELGMDPVPVQLAAQRLAPVQCNSWGQPETSGFETLDYYLSSALMEPDGADVFYTEKLVRLPGLSIYYEPLEPPIHAVPDRASFGLRADAIVYWCGQSLYKYLPRHDHIFADIARAVGNCQFAFIQFRHGDALNVLFMQRMRAAFAAQGLRAEDHVVMLPYLDRAAFAASLASADIFLDSLEWSGCNTMLESMPFDLPIVTCAGRFMRGRHGVAILRQMGLDDLITHNETDFRALAIRLAHDPVLRRQIASRIASSKQALYRDLAPIRGLEDFLQQAVMAAHIAC